MKLIKSFQWQNSFLKIVWNSAQSEHEWSGIITKCAKGCYDLEIKSLVAKMRPAAWRSIHEDNLPAFTKEMSKFGLIALPIRYTGTYQGFAHRSPELKKGQPKNVYCIISADKNAAFGFREAFEANDPATQGEFLGYPKCCREAFAENWKKGYIDPIWQAAIKTIRDSTGKEVDGDHAMKSKAVLKSLHHPYSNPIWRYVGIRLSFHIPCSFNCKATTDKASEIAQLLSKSTRALLDEILSMPVEWSVLNGIGILKTPMFYVVFNSVATREKYTVKLEAKNAKK